MTVLLGSGTSAAVTREYLHLDDPRIGVVYGSTADQRAKLQAAVDLASDSSGSQSDATIFIGGQVRFTGELVFPETIRYVRLLGAGRGSYYNDSAAALYQTADSGPETFALRLNGRNPPVQLEHFTLIGPGSADDAGIGNLPAEVSGIYIPVHTEIMNVSVRGFRAGMAIQSDHVRVARSDFQGNAYGMEFIDNPFGGLGDLQFDNCTFTNSTRASVGISSGAEIANAIFTQGHMGVSPFGFYRYEQPGYTVGGSSGNQLTGVQVNLYDLTAAVGDTVTGTNIPADSTVTAVTGSPGDYTVTLDQDVTGTVTEAVFGRRTGALSWVTFINVSPEFCGNAWMYDEPDDAGWGNILVVASADAFSGGGAKWPGKPNPMACIQVGHLDGLRFRNGTPSPDSGTPTHPYISVKDCANLLIEDPRQFIDAAATYGHKSFILRTGGFGADFNGCDLGVRSSPGSGGLHCTLRRVAEDVTQGDLLEYVDSTTVQRSRGGNASKPVGVALADYVTDDVAAILTQGERSGVVVRNLTGSTIPQTTLLKPDAANIGGVAAAATINDGPIVGQTLEAIGTGAAGAAAVWIP